MWDIIAIGLVALFFLISLAMLAGCDKLR